MRVPLRRLCGFKLCLLLHGEGWEEGKTPSMGRSSPDGRKGERGGSVLLVTTLLEGTAARPRETDARRGSVGGDLMATEEDGVGVGGGGSREWGGDGCAGPRGWMDLVQDGRGTRVEAGCTVTV